MYIICPYYRVRSIWWTDWGRNPRVERASQDGLSRTTILSDKLYWPNALTVDVYKQRLYVMDAKLDFIDACDYNGANRNRIIENKDVSEVYCFIFLQHDNYTFIRSLIKMYYMFT